MFREAFDRPISCDNARTSVLTWLVANRWPTTVGLILATGTLISLWGLGRYPVPFDDEGTYLAQAWAVLSQGELSHYTYWYDHPPLGWLLIVPWMWVTDGFGSASVLFSGRLLMVAITAASSALVYLVSLRVGLRRPFALVAMVLFVFSPLSIHFHRMVLLDNFAVFFFLLSLYLVLSPGRQIWHQQAAMIVLGLSVLTKETMLLFAPVAFLLLFQEAGPANRGYALTLGGALFASVILFYPLMAAVKGEFLPGEGHVSLIDAIRWQLFDRPGGGSVFTPGTASRATVEGWAGLDAWLLGLGAAMTPISFTVARLRAFGVGAAIALLALARPGYLPYMFVIAVIPLVAILIPGMADLAWAGRRGRHSPSRSIGKARFARPLIVLVVFPIALFGVAPSWTSSIAGQVTLDMAGPFKQAEEWIVKNIAPGTPILVDNVLWMELVARGYPTDQTIWYYKLDLDQEVADEFPGGWRDFEYLISTPVLRATARDLPNVSHALEHSTLVDSFAPRDIVGEGVRIDIRAIDPNEE